MVVSRALKSPSRRSRGLGPEPRRSTGRLVGPPREPLTRAPVRNSRVGVGGGGGARTVPVTEQIDRERLRNP